MCWSHLIQLLFISTFHKPKIMTSIAMLFTFHSTFVLFISYFTCLKCFVLIKCGNKTYSLVQSFVLTWTITCNTIGTLTECVSKFFCNFFIFLSILNCSDDKKTQRKCKNCFSSKWVSILLLKNIFIDGDEHLHEFGWSFDSWYHLIWLWRAN